MKDKIIVLDWLVFVHTAIFAWRNTKSIPMSYTLLNMIISCLRRIGVEPFDTIYIACDHYGSWRKEYAEEYKANRKAQRDKYEDIDWEQMWKDSDNMLEILDKGTDWIIIKNEHSIHLEADDIASYIVRNNQDKDKDIILVTTDGDWEQMWKFDNVKLFSPKMKPKRYKVKPNNFNIHKLISSKVKKETSDNLISPIITEKDYDTRLMLINLLELPEFVEKKLENTFANLNIDKDYNLDCIPFLKLRERIGNLYNDKDNIVDYDWCIKLEEKRNNRKKKKNKTEGKGKKKVKVKTKEKKEKVK